MGDSFWYDVLGIIIAALASAVIVVALLDIIGFF